MYLTLSQFNISLSSPHLSKIGIDETTNKLIPDTHCETFFIFIEWPADVVWDDSNDILKSI